MPSGCSGAALRTISLLESLEPQELDALAQNCRWRCVAAHQTLIQRNAPPGEVFFLLSGRVRVAAYSATGRQVDYRDMQQGSYFGEFSAIDGRARTADVYTLAPSVVASLAKADFRALIRAHSGVSDRFVHDLLDAVRILSERIFELSTMNVADRLKGELRRRGLAAGVDAQGCARIAPAPTHESLAAKVGSAREQVTRDLNALTRQGLLQKEDGALVIVDIARLESSSSGCATSAFAGTEEKLCAGAQPQVCRPERLQV